MIRAILKTSLKVCTDSHRDEVNGFLTCSADIISTVEFDQTGDYLASGDKGGRVVLFERNHGVRFATSKYSGIDN